LEAIRRTYTKGAISVDETDGLSIEFDRWRFNVRTSNTEPVIRVNVETRADHELLRQKTDEVIATLKAAAPRDPA
jgi:phosphomannomutase